MNTHDNSTNEIKIKELNLDIILYFSIIFYKNL